MKMQARIFQLYSFFIILTILYLQYKSVSLYIIYMSIRTEYKRIEQSKCNFCFNWFSTSCQKKECIHLCQPCLDKGQYTTCFKVHSPDGKQEYQLFLFKNNFVFKNYEKCQKQVEELVESKIQRKTLIEDIDVYRNKQIKQLTQKWSDVTEQIRKMETFGEEQFQRFTKLFDGVIQNYPTAKQILTEEKHKNSEKKCLTIRQKNIKNDSNEIQEVKKDHQSIYYINNVSIPILPINSSKQNIPTSPKKPSFGEITPDQNIQYAKPLSFTKAFSSKVNMKNRNLSKKAKRNDVSTSSFKTERDRQENRPLSRNPSRQYLLPQKPIRNQMEYNLKRQRDLELISKNQLKAKIYHYLQTMSATSPALFLPMTFQIYDAIQNTNCLNKCLELVSYNIQDIDIKCYLNMLEWTGIEVLKLVKVGLTDNQFKQVITFIKDKKLETLVVTSNRLTESSIYHLKESSEELPLMKYVYLGRNWIQKTKAKDEIRQIQSRFVLYV